MSHVRIQEPLFELIHCFLGLVGSLFEAGPGPHGQGDVVALAAGQPALAGLHAGELLEFAVKLLNRPADAAFLFGSGRLAGLHLVGHEVVRPVGGHQYAEEFQFAVFGHPFYFRHFASFHFRGRPGEQRHRLVRLPAARVVNEAVAPKRLMRVFSGQ